MSEVDTGVEIDGDAARVELEAKARRLGWVPKAEFKGDESRWRDAEEFMRRGETILPIVQENNRVLQDKLTVQDRQMAEMRQVLIEMRDQQRSDHARLRAQVRAQLEEEMRASVNTADPVRFEAAAARLKEIEAAPEPRPASPAPPPPQQVIDPYVQQWSNENQWMRDPALNLVAQGIHVQLQNEKPGLGIQDNLAEVKRRVQDMFPEKFGLNPRRFDAASVSSASAPMNPSRKRERGYDDLPPEAKAACDRFCRTIPGFKREDYLKTYVWD
jgi:hypothetical protein